MFAKKLLTIKYCRWRSAQRCCRKPYFMSESECLVFAKDSDMFQTPSECKNIEHFQKHSASIKEFSNRQTH